MKISMCPLGAQMDREGNAGSFNLPVSIPDGREGNKEVVYVIQGHIQ
jgi:hypothetical protein